MAKRMCIMCNSASEQTDADVAENPAEPIICVTCKVAYARMVKFPRYGETMQSKYLDIWANRIRKWEYDSLKLAVAYAKENWEEKWEDK